jgi:hypothetical protein
LKRRGRHHCRPFPFWVREVPRASPHSPPTQAPASRGFLLHRRSERPTRQRTRARRKIAWACNPGHSTSRAPAPSSVQQDGEDRCALTSRLPGWPSVWSRYGRFWCRSSREVPRRQVASLGARACGQGPCGAASLRAALRHDLLDARQPNAPPAKCQQCRRRRRDKREQARTQENLGRRQTA